MVKECDKHGLVNHFRRRDGTFRCGKCASEWVIRNRRKKKNLVKMFGDKCVLCGYNKYTGALDFHHIKRSAKSFSLSVKGLAYAWDGLIKEAKKCALVCKNCHTKIENGITKL